MMRILLLLLPLLLAAPAAQATSDPSDAAGAIFQQKPGAQLPTDLMLRDAAGKLFRLGDVMRGPPLLLALVYYRCPNLCGVVLGDLLSGLQGAGLAPGRDYRLLVVSIDPTEGPAEAAAFKARHMAEFPVRGAAANWHFLTGTQAAVATLADTVGFQAKYDAALKQYVHPAGIVVATPEGRIARYLLGVGYRPGDLKLALTEASDGTIAALSRPILLTCWHYDPATGRYSLALWTLLRIAALLTAITVGGTVFLAFRREGRPR